MIIQSIVDVVYIVVLLSFFAMAISWLAFARLSMARIEQRIRRDGLTRPSGWDVTGARVLWYATAIAFDSKIFHRADEPFIDVTTVRRYATPFDRKLSVAFLFSTYSCVLAVIAAGLLID